MSTLSHEFVLPLKKAQARFAELVDRATQGCPTVLTHRGDRVAAVVPVELFDTFRLWADERAIALIEERRTGPTVDFEEVHKETLNRD